ncbi:hypothetical protein [Ammoniphilus sp. CFH 90114]|uniref:hypothetical protein n=1 Tax=Ammoniphilus sp. CFH 90114 TaxID=2493665 RepID=UPI00100EE40B|nr:hypothetical protein [Ammoniphilus sp. CFH 90114]RXT03787.1 hypothetical protein EIZ39_22665 [Ammoniphilus sp. CFH 90114]
MNRMILFIIILSIGLLLVGCSGEKEAGSASSSVATINGEGITEEDVTFYQLINHIQLEMYREADRKRYTGQELEAAMKFWDQRIEESKERNMLLTQIIRLRAVALLAQEKGYSSQQEEVELGIDEAKKAYQSSPVAQELIRNYGEEKFWEQQEIQHQRIVLVKKVQQDILANVKQANPEAAGKELTMLAEKKYEELLVSQVGSLNIQFAKK